MDVGSLVRTGKQQDHIEEDIPTVQETVQIWRIENFQLVEEAPELYPNCCVSSAVVYLMDDVVLGMASSTRGIATSCSTTLRDLRLARRSPSSTFGLDRTPQLTRKALLPS